MSDHKNRPPRGAEAVLYYFNTLDEPTALHEMKALLADPKGFFEGHRKPCYSFIPIVGKTIEGVMATLVICYVAYNIGWAKIGIAMASSERKSVDRKLLKNIARSRMMDCPIQLEFRDFPVEQELTARNIVAAVRTLIIESPGWVPGDKKPLRPGRFKERWCATFIGPNGSLVTAWVDAKPKTTREVITRVKYKGTDGVPYIHATTKDEDCEPYIDTWCTRFPKWARKLMEA